MKNETFANTMEDEGYRRMTELNDLFQLTDFGRTEKCHHSDASGYTTTGNWVDIEYKVRNQRLMSGDSGYYISGQSRNGGSYFVDNEFIEAHKIADLLLDYLYLPATEPIYVNFLEDGIAIVHNIAHLSKRPKTQAQAKKIDSRLYGAYEMAKRIELPLEEAYIYQVNGDGTIRVLSRPAWQKRTSN